MSVLRKIFLLCFFVNMASSKPLEERSIEELRENVKTFDRNAGEAAPISYKDGSVPARDGHLLRIRIYNDQLPDTTPVLIFYPGCAYIFDFFELNGIICSRIAQHAGIKVILVQFRLAPEHSMPTSLYDGYDAASYIASHSESFGIDPTQIFVGGWCSGANCAAVISNLARQEGRLSIFHQILLSGTYDLTESNHDFDVYEQEDKTLNRNFLTHVAKQFYGITSNDYQTPLFSPIFETHFEGFPSTTILCGEYDALRNDSEGYFQKLRKGNVSVEKILLPGQTHNTIAMRMVLSDGIDPSVVIAEVIKAKLPQKE